jgi:hypothetical protein
MSTHINAVINTLEQGNAFQQYSAQVLMAISSALESQNKQITQVTVDKALDDLEGFIDKVPKPGELLKRLTTYDKEYRDKVLSSLRSALPA